MRNTVHASKATCRGDSPNMSACRVTSRGIRTTSGPVCASSSSPSVCGSCAPMLVSHAVCTTKGSSTNESQRMWITDPVVFLLQTLLFLSRSPLYRIQWYPSSNVVCLCCGYAGESARLFAALPSRVHTYALVPHISLYTTLCLLRTRCSLPYLLDECGGACGAEGLLQQVEHRREDRIQLHLTHPTGSTRDTALAPQKTRTSQRWLLGLSCSTLGL